MAFKVYNETDIIKIVDQIIAANPDLVLDYMKNRIVNPFMEQYIVIAKSHGYISPLWRLKAKDMFVQKLNTIVRKMIISDIISI